MKSYAETVWHALYNGYSWNEIQMRDIWRADVAQGPHLHGRVSWVNFPKLSLSLYVSRFTSNLFRNAYRHLS